MASLRVIPGDRSRPPPAGPARRWPLLVGLSGAAVFAAFLVWWFANAGVREIQALPDSRRIPLYHRTVENLETVCDPAASRSLRDFCHTEAELALRFRECDADPRCQELARRHLPQPRR